MFLSDSISCLVSTVLSLFTAMLEEVSLGSAAFEVAVGYRGGVAWAAALLSLEIDIVVVELIFCSPDDAATTLLIFF